MRICVDLDGVICKLKKDGENYLDLEPMDGAIAKLKSLKENNHYIIINTARHMKTCGANVGLVNARISLDTLQWLKKYDVPYDEIYFGKPWAEIYIDDNALRFKSWDLIDADGSNLPQSNEKTK